MSRAFSPKILIFRFPWPLAKAGILRAVGAELHFAAPFSAHYLSRYVSEFHTKIIDKKNAQA
jgi:hypothetical protein